MNKIMISGLAIGADKDLNVCQSCNFDLSWLLYSPSTLLWTDKIILTPEIYSFIKDLMFSKNEQLAEAIKIIFDVLDYHDLIELKSVSDSINIELRDEIYKQIIKERVVFEKIFPETIKLGDEKKVPGQIFIEGSEYCTPHIWSIYASLILSKKWGADLLLPPSSYTYIKYKFGVEAQKYLTDTHRRNAFDNVFSTKIPNLELVPSILIGNKQCGKCKNETDCSSNATSKVEKNIFKIVEWRQYDELYQLREVLQQISKKVEREQEIEVKYIIDEFKKEELAINKKINTLFPKIERWSNMATLLSIPAVVAGISTGSTTIASIGAGVAGIATATNKYIDIARSKHRWLGFKNN